MCIKDIMTFEEFKAALKEAVEARVPELAGKVCFVNVPKNNGVIMTGLTAKTEKPSPIAYIDAAYAAVGATVEAVAAQVGDMFRREAVLADVPFPCGLCINDIMDYGKVRGHIMARLVNAKRNKAFIEDGPHTIVFGDLAAIYFINLGEADGRSMSIRVRDNILEAWGTSVEDVHKAALENMSAEGHELTLLDDFLKDVGYTERAAIPMYILRTYRAGMYGAAQMLNRKALEEASQMLGGDMYIIPSSIHEVLLLEAGAMGADDLAGMVKEVNATCVSKEERLSDHAYLYDSKTGEITAA